MVPPANSPRAIGSTKKTTFQNLFFCRAISCLKKRESCASQSLGQTPSQVHFPFQAKKPLFWKPAADRELTEQRPGGTRFLSTLVNTAGSSSPKEGLQEHFPKGNEKNAGKRRGRANGDCFSAVFLVWTLRSLGLRKQAWSHLRSHSSLLGVFFRKAGKCQSLVRLSSQSPPRPTRSLATAGENPFPAEGFPVRGGGTGCCAPPWPPTSSLGAGGLPTPLIPAQLPPSARQDRVRPCSCCHPNLTARAGAPTSHLLVWQRLGPAASPAGCWSAWLPRESSEAPWCLLWGAFLLAISGQTHTPHSALPPQPQQCGPPTAQGHACPGPWAPPSAVGRPGRRAAGASLDGREALAAKGAWGACGRLGGSRTRGAGRYLGVILWQGTGFPCPTLEGGSCGSGQRWQHPAWGWAPQALH